MENINFTLIDSLILDYAHIRKKFEMYKKRFPKYMAGNDNYVGTIGEYWATRFLEWKHNSDCIQAVVEQKESGNHNLSNPWSDFELNHGDIAELVSVKAIFENKNGESGEIKYKQFSENEIGSILIIKLDDYLFPIEILYINDLDKNLLNGEKAYKDRWSEKNSLIFKYYDSALSQGFDKKLSSFIYKYDISCEKFVEANSQKG